MAENSIDKIKEQCLELILNVMPISQLAFVFVMAVIFDRLISGSGNSAINSINGIGLEKLFGLKGGLFWAVDMLVLGISFFLALINTWFLKKSLRRSFSSSKISEKLSSWATAANEAIADIPTQDRLPIYNSVNLELSKRLKKYYGKRMLCESMLSVSSCILFASLYLIFKNYSVLKTLYFSLTDIAVATFCSIAWLKLHRNSVRYAISKVIPLQVYSSACTGEIAFFIDID